MTKTLTTKVVFATATFLSILFMLGTITASANHYVFPSTNDENRDNSDPHVNQVSAAIGETTLEFVNQTNFATCFEYRTDGDTSQATGNPNFNSDVHDLYPFLCLNNNTTEMTFEADEYVEVRSVFGAERDYDFDWTRFDVLSNPDPDGDNVLTGDDKCEESAEADEFDMWGKSKGRYQWDGEAWVSSGKGDKKFTPDMEYTHGCTGMQILAAMGDATGEDFGGHYKHGLSKSILEAWHAGEYYLGKTLIDTVTVDSADFAGVDSNDALDDENDYFIKAIGTWTNRGVESVDAEYSNYNNLGWVNGPDGGYPANLLDLQVDETFVNWGALSGTNTYEIAFSPAADGVVNFRVFDHSDINAEPDGSWYGDNVGTLTVEIYEDLYVPLWP